MRASAAVRTAALVLALLLGGGGAGAAGDVLCRPSSPSELEAQLRTVVELQEPADGSEVAGGALPGAAVGLLRKGAKRLSKLRKKKGDQNLLSFIVAGSLQYQQALVEALSSAMFASAVRCAPSYTTAPR